MIPLVNRCVSVSDERRDELLEQPDGCSVTVNVPESSCDEGGCRLGTTQSLVPFVGPPPSPIQHAPEGWHWPSGSPRRSKRVSLFTVGMKRGD